MTNQRTATRQSRLASFPGGITALALAAVMAMDTADQSAIGATAPEVRSAFDISQTQIGFLATSSTVVGVLFTLPFGVLADRAHRLQLLRATVVVWIIAMIAVGSAPSYPLMLVAHSVLGLVTGGAGPLIASVIGDHVEQEQRGRVFSALLVGELMGSVLGLSVSGEIAAFIGWRWAFWVLAMAGVLVLALLTRAVEPERRPVSSTLSGDPVPTPPDLVSLRAAIVILFRNRTLVLLIVASALGYYFFAGVQTFAVSLLTDSYGVSAAVAPVLVLLVGLSLAVGVLIGGPAGDRLLRRKMRTGRLPLLVLAFAGSIAFIVPGLASSNIAITMPLLIIGGVLLGTANPALDATRIDIVAPRLRGRAEAVRATVRDGADAGAPLLFGFGGSRIGLQPTFLIMTISLGMALALAVLALRRYPQDAVVPRSTLAT